MTAPQDLDRQLQAFLRDGPTELPDPSFDAVRDRIESTHQRVVIGRWRLPAMHKLVPIGLGTAAVVVAVVGAQLLPRQGGTGTDPSVAPSVAPSASVVSPSASAWQGVPAGPYVVTSTDFLQISVDVATPGWSELAGLDALTKNDDDLDPPETVGAVLLAWTWPAGTAVSVYGDSCRWLTTLPDTAAITPEDIAAGLSAQASTNATAPVDVTVGGFAGQAITLEVPMSFHVPGGTREEQFADCDERVFGFYQVEGDTGPSRNAQGAGQIDELWILDVNGAIVILDASYSPATPPALIDELRTMAESATFE